MVINLATEKNRRRDAKLHGALSEYAGALRGILSDQKAFYDEHGKFWDFLTKYEARNFDPRFFPYFELAVDWEHPSREPEKSGRFRGWDVRRTKYAKCFRGKKSGPFATLQISPETAQHYWARHEQDDPNHGTYGYTLFGMGTNCSNDGKGKTWHIAFLTYDDSHVIETDRDLREALAIVEKAGRMREAHKAGPNVIAL